MNVEPFQQEQSRAGENQDLLRHLTGDTDIELNLRYKEKISDNSQDSGPSIVAFVVEICERTKIFTVSYSSINGHRRLD
jgi:hypothetical protein